MSTKTEAADRWTLAFAKMCEALDIRRCITSSELDEYDEETQPVFDEAEAAAAVLDNWEESDVA